MSWSKYTKFKLHLFARTVLKRREVSLQGVDTVPGTLGSDGHEPGKHIFFEPVLMTGAPDGLPVQVAAVGKVFHALSIFPYAKSRLLHHRPLPDSQRQQTAGMLGKFLVDAQRLFPKRAQSRQVDGGPGEHRNGHPLKRGRGGIGNKRLLPDQ